MPQLVKTDLWAHQRNALAKFSSKRNILCCWDMGTGKTLFAIERDLRLRHNFNPNHLTLVIAPLPTHRNWVKRFEEETDLSVKRIINSDRDNLFDDSHHVYVINYKAVAMMDDRLFKNFTHIIVDECHRIKNRKAKQAVAIKKIKGKYRTLMSGSPITTKPQDLWSLLNYLYPSQYSSYTRFINTMTDSERPWITVNGRVRQANYVITHGPSSDWFDVGYPEIEPFYDRVLLEECGLDIPPVNVTRIEVELNKKQRKQYDDMNNDFLAWVESHQAFQFDTVDDVIEKIGAGSYIDTEPAETEPLAASVVIAQLQRLQQFAAGTVYYDEEQDTYGLKTPSSKVDASMQLIGDSDEKFLVFSQFSKTIDMLSGPLQKAKIGHVYYTGRENQRTKDANLERFLTDKTCRVFISTLGAGGVGIDELQEVCHNLIFFDRAWSPTLNDQAIGRIKRYGQKNIINVWDLVTVDTIDEVRLGKIEYTKQWVAQMLSGELA